MVKISDAEIEVMKIIWEKKAVTSIEIINELKDHNWNDNTVRTLINRLIAKKAVGVSKKEGKTYTYVPLIKENEYKLVKTRRFLDQLYNGSLYELITNFVNDSEMSKEEVKDIVKRLNNDTK